MAPNWIVQLPGHHYDGAEPDGFMARDEVGSYLERYATGFQAPVREGVDVTSIRRDPGGRFVLRRRPDGSQRERSSSAPGRARQARASGAARSSPF